MSQTAEEGASISIAPTGRASCRATKEKHPIPAGALRFGISFTQNGSNHSITTYKCLACATAKAVAKAVDEAGAPDQIRGVDALSEQASGERLCSENLPSFGLPSNALIARYQSSCCSRDVQH